MPGKARKRPMPARRLQDDDPWGDLADPFSDLRDDDEGEARPALQPSFLSASECFDLQLTVQGALILQEGCRISGGPAFVQASIGKTTVATRKQGTGSNTPMWTQRLDLGCHSAGDALQLKLYTGGNDNTPCASWSVKDWLQQSATNQLAAKNTEDAASNTVVFPRSDGRVNLMVEMSTFVHPLAEAKDSGGMLGGHATKDIVLGSVFAGIGFLLILAISISCCCWCCCPAAYRARWRRFGVFSAAPTVVVTLPPAPAEMVATTVQPAPAQRPGSVPRPPPSSNAAGRRPSPPPPYHAIAPSAPPVPPPASVYGRLPPTAPQAPGVPAEAVAVALPVAEPVAGLGSSYRGGYAEARILRAESDARGGGAGGGRGGGKKGGGGRR